MTGAEFERKFCQWAKDDGWWALNIPRSKAGQQPFDVISVKGDCVLAVDCKVISTKDLRFPLERVEVNQWLAFKALQSKSRNAVIGIAIWHSPTEQMFFLCYDQLRFAWKSGQKSIALGANAKLERIDLLRRIRE